MVHNCSRITNIFKTMSVCSLSVMCERDEVLYLSYIYLVHSARNRVLQNNELNVSYREVETKLKQWR